MLNEPIIGDAAPTMLPLRVPATSIDEIMAMGTVAMDLQARILVFFNGHIDERRLSRAVRLALDAEPMLRYRFVSGSRRSYWERTEEKDWSRYFSVIEGDRFDPRFHELMTERLAPEQAPQVRVTLFRGESDLLCIRSNHVAVDGGGALQYLYLLASIYRMLGKDPGYRPAPRPAVRLNPRHVLGHAGLSASIKGLLRTRPPGAEWGAPKISDDLSQTIFRIKQVEPGRLKLIREYAREKGATINDVLLAAFCRALFETLRPPLGKRLRVEVPINLRRYVPGQGNVIGDLSSVYFLSVDRRPGEAFEETLKRVHKDLSCNKEARTELGQMMMLELLLLSGASVVSKLKRFFEYEVVHPALSNLGMVDPAVVSFGDVGITDLQAIGPTRYPPNISMEACTYGQTMNLSMNCCSSAMDIGIVDSVMDRMLEELPGGPLQKED